MFYVIKNGSIGSPLIAVDIPNYFNEKVNSIANYANENNAVLVIDRNFFMDEEYQESIINFLKNKTNKIIISDLFHFNVDLFADHLNKLHSLYDVNTNNFFIVVSYFKLKDDLENKIRHLNVNLYVYNYWLLMINDHVSKLDDTLLSSVTPSKKFSIFSRRYDPDRFILMLQLLNKNLLDNCFYTFTNCHAELIEYPHVFIEKSELLKIAKNYGFDNSLTTNWINNLPYTVDLKNLNSHLPIELYELYKKSHINIIVETSVRNLDIYITEKTFKAIFMKKPFILYGAPKVLSMLQTEGFKTFHRYINENYNYATDDEVSIIVKEVCKEIQSINSLSDRDFIVLMDNCNKIAEFNLNHAKKLAVKYNQNKINLLAALSNNLA